ncbi:MAG: hypothetical protein GY871_18960 [Actinomycetales bacterium]|nr:hypothetical protein [Actinomycetales bacterium]
MTALELLAMSYEDRKALDEQIAEGDEPTDWLGLPPLSIESSADPRSLLAVAQSVAFDIGRSAEQDFRTVHPDTVRHLERLLAELRYALEANQ